MSAEVIFKSTASEAGFSSLGLWLGCPARASMELQARAQRQTRGPYPETEKPVSTLVGSLSGELIARYYRQEPVRESSRFLWQDEDGAVTDLQKTHPLSVAEAWRLYTAYTNVRGPEYFGDPVGFEIPVEVPAELFGIRVTGAIDGGFRLTSQSAERIRTKFAREAEAGQIALVDWKTTGRATNIWDWTLKPVMQIYAVGFDLVRGEKPSHLCWDVLKKTKTVGFEEYYSDAATDANIRWLKNVFTEILRRQALGAQPEPSPSNCVTYSNPCACLTPAGVCSIL